MTKQKGKRKLNDDVGIGEEHINEIYKKLNSLDNRLGNSKDRHDHNISVFRAICEFLEQHVRSISMLSGISEAIWGTDAERGRVLSQLDANDLTHVTTLDLFTSLQTKEAGIPRKPIKVEDIPGLREAGWTPDQWGYSFFRLLNSSLEGPSNRQALLIFMRGLWKAMSEHADAWPFKEPVDPRDVPDYYDIIKDPMDLKTMWKRLESDQYYITLEMFIADVKRMFTNARTYNSPETIYFKCANRLETFFSSKLQVGIQAGNKSQQ
ncbi:hypothetical protein KI387_023977 [Taxus chinensis]|uniref:Bromo domain-containing protein n=1 Tax=Taxus chinensis TaxID=29808 RepID=A0AA38LB48_TAXCH|nr:hypothetical protein KI387_023977 [Taxus chinensis]